MNDRRRRLLDSTCRAIARRGVRGLRVEEVAADAHASTALIYYYFKDRAGLITATMAHVNDRAESYARASTGATGRERLLRQLLGEFQDDPEVRENSAVWGEVRSAAVFDPALRPVITQATDSWIVDLAAMTVEGQQDGSVAGSVDPRGLAIRLSALVEGLSNRWLADLVTTDEARQQVMAALEKEISPPMT